MADFDSEFFIDYSSLDDFQRQLIDRKNNKSMVFPAVQEAANRLLPFIRQSKLQLSVKVTQLSYIPSL